MKVGYWGGRADARGLAYQGIGYCKHLNFDRVYGIDMTADGMSPYECDWRPYETHCNDLTINRYSNLNDTLIRKWLRGLDVVFGAETFYKDEVVSIAREEGVRTVLHVNPEFIPYFHRGGEHLPRPDVLVAPTTWTIDGMPDIPHLPFPVDREVFPFHLRTSASRFVHVAGHRAAADRAGTRMVLAALPRLKDISVVIKSQSPLGYSFPGMKGRVEERNVGHPASLYADADVVVLPRRYGGNSLVHQEALSCGCPVISLDRAPENTWGGVSTIATRARQRLRTKGGTLPVYDGAPQHLTRLIQELAADPPRVESLSQDANTYAESISWGALLPIYERFFEAVMTGDESDYLRGISSTLC